MNCKFKSGLRSEWVQPKLASLEDSTDPRDRSSGKEVRIRVPFFSVVYFSRGTLPKKG